MAPQEIVPKAFETIICIPGNWNNWNDFILLVVAATEGEYLAAGNVLMNVKSKKYYAIEFCERDEKMKQSFEYAGRVTRVSEPFLNEIGNHKHVIYISGPTANLLDAANIALAAQAILKAGGSGIKIETAGKAFEKEKWYQLMDGFEESRLYEMFVLDCITDENGTVFSCGMQNLGFKDTIVAGEEFQEAVSLISIFGYYQLVDKPTIQNSQTFSIAIDAPRYRITDESNQPYQGHETFGNPFGMWRLTREQPLAG